MFSHARDCVVLVTSGALCTCGAAVNAAREAYGSGSYRAPDQAAVDAHLRESAAKMIDLACSGDPAVIVSDHAQFIAARIPELLDTIASLRREIAGLTVLANAKLSSAEEADRLRAALDRVLGACERGPEVYDDGDLDHYRVRCNHVALSHSGGQVVDCPYCEVRTANHDAGRTIRAGRRRRTLLGASITMRWD